MSGSIGNLKDDMDQNSRKSNHAGQSNQDSQQTSGKSVHPYQSVWMAHWTRTSCDTVVHSRSQLLLPYKQHNVQNVPEIETVVSNSFEGGRDVTKIEEFETRDGNLMMNPESMSKERVDSCRFPLSSLSQRKDSIFPLPESETPSSRFRSLPEISLYSELHLKTHHNFEEKSLAVTRTFENYFMGSTSKIVPSRVFSQMSPANSFLHRKEVANQSSFRLAFKEQFPNRNQRSRSFMIREANDPSQLLDDPSTSNFQLPVRVSKNYQDMQDHHGTGLFQAQRYPSQVSALENSYFGTSALPRIPYSMREVERKKICTTIDSVEKISRGPSKFSQTTHHFFASKMTDIDMAEESQILGEPTLLLKAKRNPLHQAPYMSLDHGHRSLHGVNLQTPGNGSEIGEQTNMGNPDSSAVKMKSESSSETDTMDMDSFKKTYGIDSSQLNKELRGHQNLSSSVAIDLCGEETDNGSLKLELPDMNQKLPEPPNTTSPVDNLKSSPSRTQSLDVEHFLPHVEQHITSESAACPDGVPGKEPSSRWVKRLKLSAEDSIGHVTKSSKMGEASSSEKVNRVFNKIKRCSIANTDPKLGNHHKKEWLPLDREAVILKKDKCLSTDSEKKGQDVSVLHPWIRRWCSNPTPSQQRKPNPKPAVICAPRTSNAALHELQKRHFPSIAAMALMGKAMSGFNPCEFRKRGSCIIWNVN